MIKKFSKCIFLAFFILFFSTPTCAESPPSKNVYKKKDDKSSLLESMPKRRLHGLLITGGCCHNYNFQTAAILEAVKKFTADDWKIIDEGGNGTKAQIPLYNNPDWAKGYDIIVHNECFADTSDPDYIQKITRVHASGTPAVVIHCAMHTYRAAEIDDWRQFLGVSSYKHENLDRYSISKVLPNHPIMIAVPDNWVVNSDELYVIEKIWPKTKVLATAINNTNSSAYPVAWISTYGKARVFGTTLGHSEDTFRDPVYLDMLARGILWAAGFIPDPREKLPK
ncbi:ThuA domain-containing protein [Calothrix sp. PCC 7507]|uniref:ThuA domain-containing protein n=1 Tax=Calothrix sp. PCC 7507 TaxID=99598 RepID=UPI00029EDC0F|nr:ThuA domain-containing protein [Calothrix sp. PCC 7507]AFY33883.1 hypothetical protein Cal7507_3488 [Calothrix sp. PCC 7507]